MTNYQMGLFSKMIDLNWEIDNGGYNQVVKNALTEHYCKVREELVEDMGAAEFKEYMRMGREMFAPVGGYGDESPEEVKRMYASV